MKQHGSRPLGNDYSQGQRYGVYHFAQIDLDYLDQIREQLPSLENRRTDVYEVISKKEK